MQLRCPTCRAERTVADDFPHRPFCSARCKAIDLGNWLDERYCISRPLGPEELEDDDLALH